MSLEVVRKARDPLARFAISSIAKGDAHHMLLLPKTDLVLAWFPQRLEWLDLPYLERRNEVTASPEAVTRGPLGSVLLRTAENVALYDPDGEPVCTFQSKGARTAELNGRHQRIAIFGKDRLSMYDFAGNLLFEHVVSEETSEAYLRLCWVGPDRIVTVQGETFGIWSKDDVDFIFHSKKSQSEKFSQSPDGGHFARVWGTKKVEVFRGETCESVASLDGATGFGRFLNEKTVACWDEDKLVCWDFESGDVRQTSIVNTTRIFDVTSDEDLLWSLSDIGDYNVLPSDAAFPEKPAQINEALISRDGSRYALLSAQDSHTLCRIVDTGTGNEIARGEVPLRYPHVKTFLCDGRVLLSFSSLGAETDNVFVIGPDGVRSMMGEVAYDGGDTILSFTRENFTTPPDLIRRDLELNEVETIELPEDVILEALLSTRFVVVRKKAANITSVFSKSGHSIFDVDENQLRPFFDRARSSQIDGHFASWLEDESFWYDMSTSELIGSMPRLSSWVVSVPHEKLFYIDDEYQGRVWSREGAHDVWESFERESRGLVMSDDGEHLIAQSFRKHDIYRVDDLEKLATHESPINVTYRLCSNGVLVLLDRFGQAEVYSISD